VQSGEDDDYLVSGVHRLCDESGEVRGFPALDVPSDKAPYIEPIGTVRVLQVREHPIAGKVEAVYFVIGSM
jgi:hypothetical protein